MSMGNIESYYNVVDEKVLKKAVSRKLFSDFKKKLEELTVKHGDSETNDALNEDDFWGDVQPDDRDFARLNKAYLDLKYSFIKKTGMHVSYIHLEGDGDCYDDLTPGAWYWVIPECDVFVPRKLTDNASAFIAKFGEIQKDMRFSVYG